MREHEASLCDCLVLEVVGADGVSAWVDVGEELDDDLVDMVPPALDAGCFAEHDTGPLGFTVIGPLLPAKRPARAISATAQRVDAAAVPIGLQRAAR